MFEAVTKSGDALIVHNTLPPVGTILFIAGNTVPENCVPAVGEELNRTAYAELFAAIGTTWGKGNGSTTFNVPDARGRVPEGAQTAGGYNAAGLPDITGDISKFKEGVLYQNGAFYSKDREYITGHFVQGVISDTTPVRIIAMKASRSNSIYGASTTVQPASVKLLPVIVYRSKRTVTNGGGGV